jgi:hypothetical protein
MIIKDDFYTNTLAQSYKVVGDRVLLCWHENTEYESFQEFVLSSDGNVLSSGQIELVFTPFPE